MARNEQLIRQHKLLELLERYRFGRTLVELRDEVVDELGLTSLHTRSIRRDLEALRAAGIDVAPVESPRGTVWKTGPRFRGTHKIAVSASELIALSLGRDLLLPLVGTPFWTGVESFWNKIQESLPEGVWDHYRKYRRVLHVLGTPAKSYSPQKGILKTINRAILEHRVLEIQYQSLGQTKPRTRQIRPYAVVFFQASLYIVADACEVKTSEDPVRHLKLDRFLKARALDEWFQPRQGMDIESHLQSNIGIFSGGSPRNFRIRLSPHAGRWVSEEPWHTSQKLTQQANGRVLLTIQAAHEMEIIPRVLALGPEAEVLSPKSCRRQMDKMLQETLDKYRE